MGDVHDRGAMRLRCFQVAPSLMMSPSPTSGISAWRMCGVLGSKLSFRVINAFENESGLLQTKTRRLSKRVEKNWYSKQRSSNTAMKLRRAVAIAANAGRALTGRSG